MDNRFLFDDRSIKIYLLVHISLYYSLNPHQIDRSIIRFINFCFPRYTHPPTHPRMYIYMCVCVCVLKLMSANELNLLFCLLFVLFIIILYIYPTHISDILVLFMRKTSRLGL